MRKALMLIMVIMIIFLCACSKEEGAMQEKTPPEETTASPNLSDEEEEQAELKGGAKDEAKKKETNMQIRVRDQENHIIIFQLNNSSAAKSFYVQLPMSIEVENYSHNEKIFYPAEKLDTRDTPKAEGGSGTLAYFEPWGDVVMFYEGYGPHNRLYELGEVISGEAEIQALSRKIQIEVVTDTNEEQLSEKQVTSALGQTAPAAVKVTDSKQVAAANKSAGASEKPATLGKDSSATQKQQEVKPKAETAEKPPKLEETAKPEISFEDKSGEVADTKTSSLKIIVSNQTFLAKLYSNEATEELIKRMPMTVKMNELNGNEKYIYLPSDFPTSAQHPRQIQQGDLMLYGSDCLVLFYQNFPTSYSYTPLGHIENPSGLVEALGKGSVEITFQTI